MAGTTTKPASSHLHRCMQAALDNREARGMKRALKAFPEFSIDFSSNDFLSLGTRPSFRKTYLDNLRRASETLRLSGTGSRLLDGNSTYAEDLESFIAAFHNAECGLLFTSGFDLNKSVFSCIPQPGDVIIYDELVHASTHDGMRMSRAGKRIPFKHNSVEAFERVLVAERDTDLLIRDGNRSVFVAVESLYSMDGDFAPIRKMLDVLERVLPLRNGHMIVDEAHSTGIIGPKGAGVVQELGVEGRVFLRLHTFGKALAGNGGKLLPTYVLCFPRVLVYMLTVAVAIALCSPLTKEYLLNYARPLIFTTAPGLPTLVLIRTAYEVMACGGTEQVGSHLLPPSLPCLPSPILTIKPAPIPTPAAHLFSPEQIPPHLPCIPKFKFNPRNPPSHLIPNLRPDHALPAGSCSSLPGPGPRRAGNYGSYCARRHRASPRVLACGKHGGGAL